MPTDDEAACDYAVIGSGTGGAYFFLPSLSALRYLASLDE